MITGDRSLAQGKKGAFYNTLEEFHKYWERVDIICPKAQSAKRSPRRSLRRSAGKAQNHNSKLKIFDNVYIHESPWLLIFHPFWILRQGLRIIQDTRYEIQDTIMTVHDYPPFYNGLGAWLLWRKTRIPYVLEIMHIPGHPKTAGFKEIFYKWLMRVFARYSAKRAGAVRVINQKQTPEFLIKSGVPKEKIRYIPAFYIDLETFRPMPEVKKDYDLVFAARLERNKGILNLIEVVKIVKQSKPDIKLLVIGSGSELDRIKLNAKRYTLNANIFFSGWLPTLEDVARAYNSARVFINPSLNEGGPRVVLEAMACGLPVITTRVGLMLDIIKNGDNGLFTDWNPHGIADRILHLLYSENLQKKFSSAGLELVKQFEKKAAIKNYAEKLKNLA